MKKAVISVFLVLTLVLNMFGFGVLEARSSAVAGVDDALIIGFLGTSIIGLCGSLAAGYGESLDTYFSEHYSSYMQNLVNSINAGNLDQLFCLNYSNNQASFVPVSDLSGDDLEFANFMCNYLNNHSKAAINAYISSYEPDPALAWFGLDGIKRQISASLYEQLKSDASNAFIAYLEMKKRNLDVSEGLEALEEATGEEWTDPYLFDFTGPLTPIQMQQSVNSLDSINVEGIQFIAPVIIDSISLQGYPSLAYCNSRGLVRISGNDSFGYTGYYPAYNHYGGGNYLLYNGDIFYFSVKYHQTTLYPAGNVNSQIDLYKMRQQDLPGYCNSNGVSIASMGVSSVVGLYSGTFYWTEPGTNQVPTPDELEYDDFTSTTPGDTINYDRTDDENTIGQAITLGLISDDPEITIDSEGNITAVDGIDLSVLENLVQELLNHTYDFSSFEEYLQTITALLQASNVNTDQISDVLNALRAWEASQDDALSSINTNVASIADALTRTYELEDDDDIDTQDIYYVEHSGLVESTTIVNTAMPFVGQMRTLINNLFDPNNFNNTPPNFHFYADFDNDGVNERYNALDLSFLETRLTNENLEDKGRFPQPVTVRELLQDILVLIVYSFFAFSMLKRIPSLINGSSSDEKNVINIRGD